MNLFTAGVAMLLMSGILAAGLVTASTFLSLVDFSASSDITPNRGDDSQCLRGSRKAMLSCSSP